jgi:phosphopantetheine adenylyltransferase
MGGSMSVGYLAQAFDLINVRDLDLIGQAADRCSRLVIGVYTDEYAEELYGRRPVIPLAERVTLVSHVRGVDEVVVHDEEIPVGDVVTFTVADQPGSGAHTVVLEARRVTSSVRLREALEPVGRGEAVA